VCACACAYVCERESVRDVCAKRDRITHSTDAAVAAVVHVWVCV